MSAANLLTISRMVLVLPFAAAVIAAGPPGPDDSMSSASWAAVAIFAVASASDLFDGYLARRFDAVTPVGEVLDPAADKILVGAALVLLVWYRSFPLWAALVIALREVAVSVLRSAALRRGRRMPASIQGKVKTALQIPMVIVWLFPPAGTGAAIQQVALYVAVTLTLVSGAAYLVKMRQLLQPADARGH